MITKLKENNFLIEVNEDLLNKEKAKQQRPNIDNLIKRIIVKKRKEKRRNLLIFSFCHWYFAEY
jgi:hypothetical protein